jgi:hypothetical protein
MSSTTTDASAGWPDRLCSLICRYDFGASPCSPHWIAGIHVGRLILPRASAASDLFIWCWRCESCSALNSSFGSLLQGPPLPLHHMHQRLPDSVDASTRSRPIAGQNRFRGREARFGSPQTYQPKTYSAVCMARITTGTLQPANASMTSTMPAYLRIENLEEETGCAAADLTAVKSFNACNGGNARTRFGYPVMRIPFSHGQINKHTH